MNDDFLDDFFELCRSTYERMEREGSWPWAEDSQDSDDLLDSED